MKREKFLQYLRANGCVFLREAKGSHTQYANCDYTKTSIVPSHADINQYTIEAICKQLGIPKPKSK